MENVGQMNTNITWENTQADKQIAGIGCNKYSFVGLPHPTISQFKNVFMEKKRYELLSGPAKLVANSINVDIIKHIAEQVL